MYGTWLIVQLDSTVSTTKGDLMMLFRTTMVWYLLRINTKEKYALLGESYWNTGSIHTIGL